MRGQGTSHLAPIRNLNRILIPNRGAGGVFSECAQACSAALCFMHEILDISALLCAWPWVGSANVMLGRVSMDLNQQPEPNPDPHPRSGGVFLVYAQAL